MKLIDKLFYFFALPLLVLIAIAAFGLTAAPTAPAPQVGTSYRVVDGKRVEAKAAKEKGEDRTRTEKPAAPAVPRVSRKSALAQMLSRPSIPRPEPVLSPQDIIYQRMDLLKSLVRDTAKDPGSIEFLQEYYSDSTSCVVYTGTNGFGARVKGVASLHDGQFSTSQKIFDRVCK